MGVQCSCSTAEYLWGGRGENGASIMRCSNCYATKKMLSRRKSGSHSKESSSGTLDRPWDFAEAAILEIMDTFPRFDLTGRIALVTGAARGLGHAIALALANAGADVAVGLRDVKADGDLPHKITGLRRRVLPLQMDLTKQDQISRAVDDTVKHFGRLDILVNNAGIAPGNLAEDVTEHDYDLTMQVNLKATFFAAQAAGRVMIRQKGGRIINMSSQAGFAALP